LNDNGDRPIASKPAVPAYNGFHAGLHMHQGKSKAYFHASYNQPPNNSVVKDVINKLADIITTDRMPFGFLVEDHPVSFS